MENVEHGAVSELQKFWFDCARIARAASIFRYHFYQGTNTPTGPSPGTKTNIPIH